MRTLGLGGRAFGMAMAVAFLTGCGGTQVGGPGAPPRSNANTAQTKADGHSRMLPGTSSGALIYAVGGCGGTCVLSYPGGKLVGTLDTDGFADCSDTAGNVFITSNSEVVEYAHSGAMPIATLYLPGNTAQSCSIDPTTGNLAVVFRGSGGDIAIFPQATGTADIYSSQINSQFCGYDGSGNLFVDGYSGQQVGFSELPSGGTQFRQLSISKYAPAPPAQVQWDGKFITYESVDHSHIRVSRLQLSGSALNIAGVTHFKIKGNAALSWLFGRKILIPYGGHQFHATAIGVWRYPKGGKAVQRITNFGNYQRKTLKLSAVTLSVASRDKRPQ